MLTAIGDSTVTVRHEKLALSRNKLLDASLYVIRARGYEATTVDAICADAGLSKGSFFHHFKSKEDLALAAAEHFSTFAESVFSTAPYHSLPDPVDRLLGYVDFRKAILAGELPQFTCLLGTMVQETYETHPAIRAACDKYISAHAATLEADIAEAMAARGLRAEWTPKSLALYTQAVIQGSFILAKAQGGQAVAADCLDHLRRYLEQLFPPLQHASATQFESDSESAKEIPAMPTTVNLSNEPESVQFPETHYVYLERQGHIPTIAPQTWAAVAAFGREILEHNRILGGAALYKTNPDTYRAGFMLAAPPLNLPKELSYAKLPGGKFTRFTLTGPYSQLPEATRRAFEIVAEKKIELRDDFNIERYLKDPMTTPEEELVTEILFPTA